MRATQKQLDKAARELALATDTDHYKSLLTVAVLAINEREDRLAANLETYQGKIDILQTTNLELQSELERAAEAYDRKVEEMK